jgi:hypothetical protein
MTSGDSGGGAGGPALVSSAADKKRAATYMEQHQLPDTRSAGAMDEGGAGAYAPAASGTAGRSPVYGPFVPPATGKPDTGLTGLSHWATDAGLSQAMTTWRGQVSRLMTRLEGELSALRSTNTLFQGNDLLTGSQIRSVQPGSPDIISRVGDL